MKIKNILLYLFIIKITLDFISPFRELNFVVINTICMITLFLNRTHLKVIKRKEWAGIFVFVILCFMWLAISGELRYFIKFISTIILFLTVRICFERIMLDEVISLTSTLIKAYFFIIVIHYLLSLLLASPANRLFYNFEHANLLGSYVLLSLTFIYSMKMLNRDSLMNRICVVIASGLTTSTGTLLSSFVVFLNVKKLNIRTLILAICSALLVIIFLYNTFSYFFPELFIKVFGPFQLLFSGGWGELAALSKHRLSMQELGDEYQSSLVWRFYAYIIFWDYLIEQPLIYLLFGNGFWGFFDIWDGIAPHNDFLLILVDFGIIGFSITLFYLSKAISWCIKENTIILPVFIVFILRMMFENNVYSYYLLSGLVMSTTYLYCVYKKCR